MAAAEVGAETHRGLAALGKLLIVDLPAEDRLEHKENKEPTE